MINYNGRYHCFVIGMAVIALVRSNMAAAKVSSPLPSKQHHAATTTTNTAFVSNHQNPRRATQNDALPPVEIVKLCSPITTPSGVRCYSSKVGGISSADESDYLKTLQKAQLASMVSSSSSSNKNDKSTTTTESIASQSPEMYKLSSPQPDYVTVEKGQRIVAFGDVHGDIRALREFLVLAQVLDPESTLEDPKWSGEETICIQCGDVLDRGDDELACYRLLASLSRQASEAGGSLTCLYGNHEVLNAAGLFQYANAGGNAEYEREIGALLDTSLGTNRWRLEYAGNQPSRWAAMEPGGLLAEPLLANMKVSIVVGRSVFVHAGLTADHIKQYGGIEGMNQEARDWILENHHGDYNNIGMYKAVEEVVADAEDRARQASRTMPECLSAGQYGESPVWMRDYSSPNDTAPRNPMAQQMIDDALGALGHGVERMVMGHTPQHHINAALQGKAWRVDVGASAGVMSGTPEVLEIIHGGETEQDTINILSRSGKKAATERQVVEMLF